MDFLTPGLSSVHAIVHQVHVTKNSFGCNSTVGQDSMSPPGTDIINSQQTIEWCGAGEAVMHLPVTGSNSTGKMPCIFLEPAALHLSDHPANCHKKETLNAKCKKADLHGIADECAHLAWEECEVSFQLLTKCEELFDGTLGEWNSGTCNIELCPDVKPCHARSFPVPKTHKATSWQEMECPCELGTLEKIICSEWAAPAFVIQEDRSNGLFHFRFPRSQQTNHTKTASNCQNAGHAAETGRFPVCHVTGPQNGALPH